jgi:crotonobetainyl-CoA:carnitine CoA-transferase CaiB-like acyl-CoA transferase
VPVGPINTAETLLTDAHAAFREMVVRKVTRQGWEVPMSGIVPKFSRTPGHVAEPGPELGAHTRSVLTELAGVPEPELDDLAARGII